MLWHLDFADSEETAPSKASQILEIGKANPQRVFLIKLNQFWAHTPTRPFIWLSQGSHTLGHYPSVLNTSGLGTQTPWDSLYASGSADIIWTSQS